MISNKQDPATTNEHITTEELLEAMFSVTVCADSSCLERVVTAIGKSAVFTSKFSYFFKGQKSQNVCQSQIECPSIKSANIGRTQRLKLRH